VTAEKTAAKTKTYEEIGLVFPELHVPADLRPVFMSWRKVSP